MLDLNFETQIHLHFDIMISKSEEKSKIQNKEIFTHARNIIIRKKSAK